MAGWRIGFVVGNAEILKTLNKTKSYLDFGIFRAVQEGAIAALEGPQDCVADMVKLYKQRRDILVDGLNAIGWKTEKPKATFYVWTRIPHKYSALTALEFVKLMVDEVGVAVAPGTGFGEYGEGWVRFALVEPEDRIKKGLVQLKKLLDAKV
jgi:alanine-synthesizing transaminase